MGRMKDIIIKAEENTANKQHQMTTELEISFSNGNLRIKEYDNVYEATLNEWLLAFNGYPIACSSIRSLQEVLLGLQCKESKCWCALQYDDASHRGTHSQECLAAMRAMTRYYMTLDGHAVSAPECARCAALERECGELRVDNDILSNQQAAEKARCTQAVIAMERMEDELVKSKQQLAAAHDALAEAIAERDEAEERKSDEALRKLAAVLIENAAMVHEMLM